MIGPMIGPNPYKLDVCNNSLRRLFYFFRLPCISLQNHLLIQFRARIISLLTRPNFTRENKDGAGSGEIVSYLYILMASTSRASAGVHIQGRIRHATSILQDDNQSLLVVILLHYSIYYNFCAGSYIFSPYTLLKFWRHIYRLTYGNTSVKVQVHLLRMWRKSIINFGYVSSFQELRKGFNLLKDIAVTMEREHKSQEVFIHFAFKIIVVTQYCNLYLALDFVSFFYKEESVGNAMNLHRNCSLFTFSLQLISPTANSCLPFLRVHN